MSDRLLCFTGHGGFAIKKRVTEVAKLRVIATSNSTRFVGTGRPHPAFVAM